MDEEMREASRGSFGSGQVPFLEVIAGFGRLAPVLDLNMLSKV